MTRRNTLLVGCVAAVAMIAAYVPGSDGQAPAPADDEVFSSESVLVMRDKDEVAVLESPRVRELGGRTFLVGKEQQESNFARAAFGGATIWVPIDDVKQLVELK